MRFSPRSQITYVTPRRWTQMVKSDSGGWRRDAPRQSWVTPSCSHREVTKRQSVLPGTASQNRVTAHWEKHVPPRGSSQELLLRQEACPSFSACLDPLWRDSRASQRRARLHSQMPSWSTVRGRQHEPPSAWQFCPAPGHTPESAHDLQHTL